MRKNNTRGVTLLEVIIALTIFSMIIIGFGSIDYFVRFQLISSVRRTSLQNTASFVMNHIQKHLMRALGNESRDGADRVVNRGGASGADDTCIAVRIDQNNDGRITGVDPWIGYRLNAATHELLYCSDCAGMFCSACNVATEVVGTRIFNFTHDDNEADLNTINILADNFVSFEVTSCWDPNELLHACGTAENPSVTMQAFIAMPSVATN